MIKPEKTNSNLNSSSSMLAWLIVTDRKRLGLIYLIAGCAVLAAGISQDLFAGITSPDSHSGFLSETGIILWFACLIPALLYFPGNYLLPDSLGLGKLSFTRLNSMGFYFWAAGLLCLVFALYSGVSSDALLFSMSRVVMKETYSGTAAAGIVLLCVSSIISSITFITTIHQKKVNNMKWMEVPCSAWGIYSASIILLVISTVLSAAVRIYPFVTVKNFPFLFYSFIY